MLALQGDGGLLDELRGASESHAEREVSAPAVDHATSGPKTRPGVAPPAEYATAPEAPAPHVVSHSGSSEEHPRAAAAASEPPALRPSRPVRLEDVMAAENAAERPRPTAEAPSSRPPTVSPWGVQTVIGPATLDSVPPIPLSRRRSQGPALSVAAMPVARTPSLAELGAAASMGAAAAMASPAAPLVSSGGTKLGIPRVEGVRASTAAPLPPPPTDPPASVEPPPPPAPSPHAAAAAIETQPPAPREPDSAVHHERFFSAGEQGDYEGGTARLLSQHAELAALERETESVRPRTSLPPAALRARRDRLTRVVGVVLALLGLLILAAFLLTRGKGSGAGEAGAPLIVPDPVSAQTEALPPFPVPGAQAPESPATETQATDPGAAPEAPDDATAADAAPGGPVPDSPGPEAARAPSSSSPGLTPPAPSARATEPSESAPPKRADSAGSSSPKTPPPAPPPPPRQATSAPPGQSAAFPDLD
jgi:hypothetical protein